MSYRGVTHHIYSDSEDHELSHEGLLSLRKKTAEEPTTAAADEHEKYHHSTKRHITAYITQYITQHEEEHFSDSKLSLLSFDLRFDISLYHKCLIVSKIDLV